jgi:hypothetical protein
MNPDCTLCLEWEICPFHKPEKRETALTKYVESEEPTAKFSAASKPVCGRVVSDCGHYVRTYKNGVCVDEEPID